MQIDDHDPSLCREFVRQAKVALSTVPELSHDWSIDEDEDHCILNVPKTEEDGFDITIEVSNREITISAEVAHLDVDFSNNAEETCNYALAIFRDLLSEDMRIREKTSNGKPYRWDIQFKQNGRWITEESSGLFFWNYFGRRHERYLINRRLPGRMNSFQGKTNK